MKVAICSVVLACAMVIVAHGAEIPSPQGIDARPGSPQLEPGSLTNHTSVKTGAPKTTALKRSVVAKPSLIDPEAGASIEDTPEEGLHVSREGNATAEAENRTADVQAGLTTLATVREEAGGAVISLSGRILFASNQSTILPGAQNQLSRVADALLALKGRTFTVWGYTDMSDSSHRNPELSNERAVAVRSFFISHGCSGDLIQVQRTGEGIPDARTVSAGGMTKRPGLEIFVNQSVK